VQLRQLSPAMIDNMFQELFAKGLSNSTVRYAQRILNVSMEAARKYHYIETNPARDIITKFEAENTESWRASKFGQQWASLSREVQIWAA